MNYNLFLFILLISTFLSYISFIVIKYGVQKSISESYYRLPNNLKFLFTLFCWGISLPTIIICSTPLMFFAGCGIMFVGAAAAFDNDKMSFDIHMFSAFSGVILSQISIWVDINMWYLTLIFISVSLLLILLHKRLKYFWWIEITAIILIIIVLTKKIFLI